MQKASAEHATRKIWPDILRCLILIAGLIISVVAGEPLWLNVFVLFAALGFVSSYWL